MASVALATASWLGAATSHARAEHVVNRCPWLSATEFEELDARVLLLLSSEVPKSVPVVVCTTSEAWVEWNGQRFAIVGHGAIADEVVDLIEAELHADAPSSRPGASGAESASLPTQPALPSPARARAATVTGGTPADRTATRPADARGGGVSLAIETELPSDTISTAVGPAFDFAASVGPLLIGAREAIRLSVTGPRVSLMDLQGTVGYGAPLDPGARFGVVGRFGAEWLVVYSQGNSGQATVVPVAELGLRVAHPLGVVGLWFGVDAHFRLSTLARSSRGTLAANDIGGSFTLGVAFVDWSRK